MAARASALSDPEDSSNSASRLNQNSITHQSPVSVKKAHILLSTLKSKQSYGPTGSFHHSNLHNPVATMKSGL